MYKNNKIHFCGSFLSDWLVKSWDASSWEKELSAMQEVGIEYLIIAPALLVRKDGTSYVNYPTKIKEYEKCYEKVDVIENTLFYAKKYGMKVFIGLNMDDIWWENWWDPDITLKNSTRLYEAMKTGNLVADELYKNYKSRYPDTFYGWYWVWEFWNSNMMTLEVKGRNQNINIFCNCININLDHLAQLDKTMPLLLSPFANMALNTYEDLYHMWKDILQNAHFKDGDIFCPQDSVGAGGTKLTQLRKCYKAYKMAADTKPGLQLWANNENFEHEDWSSATLDRFIKQMEITAEFVEKNITFIYNNYYSPLNINKGFHETFKLYLKNGVLPTEPPLAPENVKARFDKDSCLVTWDRSNDVFGYYIIKDKKVIGSVKCDKKDGQREIPLCPDRYTDQEGVDEKAEYGVCAVDFAGNISRVSYAEILK